MPVSGQARPGASYEVARVYIKLWASESHMAKDEQERKIFSYVVNVGLIRDSVNAPLDLEA